MVVILLNLSVLSIFHISIIKLLVFIGDNESEDILKFVEQA